ncbi:MAG: DNA gyrase modulator [Nocardioidaceae bacterium]
MSPVDQSFTALPLHRLADAALQRARDFGVSHADFRLERLRGQRLGLRDAELEGVHDTDEVGFGVRVILDGTWGFASGVDLTAQEVVRVTEEAVQVAQVSAAISPVAVELAGEAGSRRRDLGLGVRRQPVGRPGRGEGRDADRLEPACPGT